MAATTLDDIAGLLRELIKVVNQQNDPRTTINIQTEAQMTPGQRKELSRQRVQAAREGARHGQP